MHHDLLHRFIRRIHFTPSKRRIHRFQQQLHVLLVPNHRIGEGISAPQKENSLRHLHMARIQTLRKSLKQRFAVGNQVRRTELAHQILQFVEKQHFFGAGSGRPIAKQPFYDLPMSEQGRKATGVLSEGSFCA